MAEGWAIVTWSGGGGHDVGGGPVVAACGMW